MSVYSMKNTGCIISNCTRISVHHCNNNKGILTTDFCTCFLYTDILVSVICNENTRNGANGHHHLTLTNLEIDALKLVMQLTVYSYSVEKIANTI